MSKGWKEILVIDDDDAILKMVDKILTTSGYRVHTAENIAEAMAIVQLRVPHLVITDLKLRGESGFEYLERHRRTKEVRSVPVIVLSSVRSPEAIYQASSLGASDYVTKPIDAATLVNKVKKTLKDRKFPHVTFSSERPQRVQIHVRGNILQASEIGFLIEAPVRVAENTRVELTSPLLRELAIDSCVFQRTQLPPRPGFPGQYLNDIAVIGLNSVHAGRIRKIMKNWK